MNPNFPQFKAQITHPLKFRFFMLQRLPAAFFAGLRIRHFDEHGAGVSVKHKWFNQNPFHSMYFAIQSMAAEMSTGLLGFGQVYKRNPAVSMLVVGLEAVFLKKVTDTVTFTCLDGDAINQTIATAIATGEAQTIACKSTGTNQAGERVAEFIVTWSFKARK